MRLSAIVTAFAASFLATGVSAGQLSTIATWSDNPSTLGSSLVYTPDTIPESPAIILGVRIYYFLYFFSSFDKSLFHFLFSIQNLELLLTVSIAPSLRWHRPDVLPNDPFALIRGHTWSHPPIPHVTCTEWDELLGRPFRQVLAARWWRRLSESCGAREVGSRRVQWRPREGLCGRWIIRRDGIQRPRRNLSRCLQRSRFVLGSASGLLGRLTHVDADVARPHLPDGPEGLDILGRAVG